MVGQTQSMVESTTLARKHVRCSVSVLPLHWLQHKKVLFKCFSSGLSHHKSRLIDCLALRKQRRAIVLGVDSSWDTDAAQKGHFFYRHINNKCSFVQNECFFFQNVSVAEERFLLENPKFLEFLTASSRPVEESAR